MSRSPYLCPAHRNLKKLADLTLVALPVLRFRSAVGEMPFSHDTQLYIPYTLPKNNELQMVFQFEIADMDGEPESPMKARKWTLSTLKEIIGRWQMDMIAAGGWNSL